MQLRLESASFDIWLDSVRHLGEQEGSSQSAALSSLGKCCSSPLWFAAPAQAPRLAADPIQACPASAKAWSRCFESSKPWYRRPELRAGSFASQWLTLATPRAPPAAVAGSRKGPPLVSTRSRKGSHSFRSIKERCRIESSGPLGPPYDGRVAIPPNCAFHPHVLGKHRGGKTNRLYPASWPAASISRHTESPAGNLGHARINASLASRFRGSHDFAAASFASLESGH